MTRGALAFSLLLAGAVLAAPVAAQTTITAPVQKKSARTGNYVQVPRTRCS